MFSHALNFSLCSTAVYIRLKGSSLPYAGRVEVSNDGELWGTVCDKDWNIKDARVVCRQLDFSFTEAAVPMAGFGRGSGPIFLKDVKCNGFEQSLLRCKHDRWKTHDVNVSCDHSMDAGVVCRPHKESKFIFSTFDVLNPLTFIVLCLRHLVVFILCAYVLCLQLPLNTKPEPCIISNTVQNSLHCINIEIY